MVFINYLVVFWSVVMIFIFVFEIIISVLVKIKKGSFFFCCCIFYYGCYKGLLFVFKICGLGMWIFWKVWKLLIDLLNMGINCGLEIIVKGVFWFGMSMVVIFLFVNCFGMIWNWVVFNKLGVVFKFFMWFGVERVKFVDFRGEVIGKLMVWDCGNGSFFNVGGVGFIIGG